MISRGSPHVLNLMNRYTCHIKRTDGLDLKEMSLELDAFTAFPVAES